MDLFLLKITHPLFSVLDGVNSIPAYTTAILSSYIVTLVIAKSSLFLNIREWVISKTPFGSTPGYPHFIECRLCLGAWVSLGFSLIYGCNWVIVWSVSYLLATQERG